MGAAALLPLVLEGLSAGASYINTRNTEHKQDAALAQQIRDQGQYQQQADSKVNQEVATLSKSSSAASKQKALDDYTNTLLTNKKKTNAGLTQDIGSAAFKADQAAAAKGVDQYGAQQAGLMSRIDAPTMQRTQEGYGYGNLGTDLGLIGRDAQGTNFIDSLKLRQIRRNPWLDLASQVAGGAAGAMGGGGGGGIPDPSSYLASGSAWSG